MLKKIHLAVGAVIVRNTDGRLLMAIRRKRPHKGRINVVFEDYVRKNDQNLITALQNNLKQSMGVAARITAVVGIYGPRRYFHCFKYKKLIASSAPAAIAEKTPLPVYHPPQVSFVFGAIVPDVKLKPTKEYENFSWIRPETLSDRMLAFDQGSILCDYLTQLNFCSYQRDALALIS